RDHRAEWPDQIAQPVRERRRRLDRQPLLEQLGPPRLEPSGEGEPADRDRDGRWEGGESEVTRTPPRERSARERGKGEHEELRLRREEERGEQGTAPVLSDRNDGH